MAARFWVLGTGTWDATNIVNWSATSGGIGGASVPVAGDTVTFDALSGGGIVTVGASYNPDVTSITMGAFTGTLDFSVNNNNPIMQTFNCSGTGTRTLNMGSGTWTITGNGTTVFTWQTTTNLTLNIGTSTINLTYSGSAGQRAVRSGDSSTYALPPINVSAGTDSFQISGGAASAHYNGLNFTGFLGNFDLSSSFNSQNCYGDIILSPTMTTTNTTGSKTINMLRTGAQSINTNGTVLKVNLTINGIGNVTTLQNNLDLTNVLFPSTLTLTTGTLNANNFNVTCAVFSSSNANTRVITMGNRTWTLTGTGTVWNTSTTTNLTLNANTSTITVNDSSASSKTMAFGALTYYGLYLTGGGTGTMIIGTSALTRTFNNIRIDEPLTVQFFAGSTTVLTSANFNVTGNGGQFNTLQSTTPGVAWNLSLASGTIVANYISLQDSNATGGGTFYAGANSLNVSNNTGWIFTNQQGGAGQTAKIDANGTRAMLAVSNADFETPVRVAVDGNTGALLVSAG